MRGAALRTWRRLHRWSSIICTAFLLILCLTGLPLIFSDEIENLTDASKPATHAAANMMPPSPDALVGDARGHYPGQRVRVVILDTDSNEVRISLSKLPDAPWPLEHWLTYDGRSGALLRDGNPPSAGVMATILALHMELLAGLPGELALGVIGLVFLAALVSGVVLYAPFMRRLNYGAIRKSGSRRLRMLDTHNLTGMTVGAWMLVVAATGIMNTLSKPLFGLWVMRDVAPRLAEFHTHPSIVPSASVVGAITTAAKATGMKVVSITFPSHVGGSPLHYVVWTAGRTKLGSRLMTPVLVDAKDDQLVLVGRMPWYLRLLELSRPLHFGDYGGIVLKLLWAASDVVTIFVLGSGLYLLAARRPRSVQSSEEARLLVGEA